MINGKIHYFYGHGFNSFLYVYQRVHIQIYVIDHGLIPNMCNSSFDPWTHGTYGGDISEDQEWQHHGQKNIGTKHNGAYIYIYLYTHYTSI